MNPPVYQMVFTEPSIAVKKPLHPHFSRFFFIISVESGCRILRQTAICFHHCTITDLSQYSQVPPGGHKALPYVMIRGLRSSSCFATAPSRFFFLTGSRACGACGGWRPPCGGSFRPSPDRRWCPGAGSCGCPDSAGPAFPRRSCRRARRWGS